MKYIILLLFMGVVSAEAIVGSDDDFLTTGEYEYSSRRNEWSLKTESRVLKVPEFENIEIYFEYKDLFERTPRQFHTIYKSQIPEPYKYSDFVKQLIFSYPK